MTLAEIYNWLLETDPDQDKVQTRMVWKNMASYCYFINTLDFNSEYHSRLVQVLQKSQKFGVDIPDDNHQTVLDIAKNMNSVNGDMVIKKFLHE